MVEVCERAVSEELRETTVFFQFVNHVIDCSKKEERTHKCPGVETHR